MGHDSLRPYLTMLGTVHGLGELDLGHQPPMHDGSTSLWSLPLVKIPISDEWRDSFWEQENHARSESEGPSPRSFASH